MSLLLKVSCVCVREREEGEAERASSFVCGRGDCVFRVSVSVSEHFSSVHSVCCDAVGGHALTLTTESCPLHDSVQVEYFDGMLPHTP